MKERLATALLYVWFREFTRGASAALDAEPVGDAPSTLRLVAQPSLRAPP